MHQGDRRGLANVRVSCAAAQPSAFPPTRAPICSQARWPGLPPTLLPPTRYPGGVCSTRLLERPSSLPRTTTRTPSPFRHSGSHPALCAGPARQSFGRPTASSVAPRCPPAAGRLTALCSLSAPCYPSALSDIHLSLAPEHRAARRHNRPPVLSPAGSTHGSLPTIPIPSRSHLASRSQGPCEPIAHRARPNAGLTCVPGRTVSSG